MKKLDRRVIYLLVLLALSLPLIFRYTIRPARMVAAEKVFSLVQNLDGGPEKIAFVALDFGPSTIAENGPQAQVILEHLMRRRIPIAVTSLVAESTAILNSIPEEVAQRLMAEMPGEQWVYGKDWVNLGYLAGGVLAIQTIPKSEDLVKFFRKDARGNNLEDLPAFRKVRVLQNIALLVEITGTPIIDAYIQFFQSSAYRPPLAHGCTSIMTPQSYIYLDSGQMQGLFEGIAGAAWYSDLLHAQYPKRPVDDSAVINTGLGVAHLVIIGLIILGNIVGFFSRTSGVPRR